MSGREIKSRPLEPRLTISTFILDSVFSLAFNTFVMTGRWRAASTWTAFLLTFPWLFLDESKGSIAALWPSFLALGLAFVTRDIYLALFTGAFSGAILLRDGNVALAFVDLFARHMLPALADPWNISVLVFTLLMGGFVEVLRWNGGMTALAAWAVGRGRSGRRTELSVYLLGWVVFLDGLANAMLVGRCMRPITDRARIAREKLAFIVDSTSSPIAGLALVSTWVAYEMAVIKEGFANAGIESIAPFQVLVASLPFRFYNFFILFIVFLTIWLGREIGPMRLARDAARRGLALGEGGQAAPNTKAMGLAIVPLLVLLASVFGGLYIQGGGWGAPLTLSAAIDAFGKADAALVFVCATGFSSVVALILSAFVVDPARQRSGVEAYMTGMQHLFLPVLVLVFAWTLNSVMKEMGTASYLVSLLSDRLAPGWLPVLVFLLSASVSFSTGTSWGTMAIVMPLIIPLAIELAGPGAGLSGIISATVGAVLAGAVFGDHCSPISDTTIVSAISSECDPMEHVRTQLPYALIAAGLAAILGYGPAGWGVSVAWLLPIGFGACWAAVRFAGSRASE